MQSIREIRERLRLRSPVFRVAEKVATVLLYAAMLIAILALWNNDAPQFIYVAF